MCLCLEEGEGAGLRTDVLQQQMRGRSADIIAMCSSAVLLLLSNIPMQNSTDRLLTLLSSVTVLQKHKCRFQKCKSVLQFGISIGVFYIFALTCLLIYYLCNFPNLMLFKIRRMSIDLCRPRVTVDTPLTANTYSKTTASSRFGKLDCVIRQTPCSELV
jgi:hypothetical protein